MSGGTFLTEDLEMLLTMTARQVASDIQTHIQQCGGGFAGWYAGIASDLRNRMFVDHSVDETTGPWIFRDAGYDVFAPQVEDYLHSQGCRGACGGGGPDTPFVYCYRITNTKHE